MRKEILFSILRVVAGLIFIFSGITKMLGITAFELYVYDMEIVNLFFTQLLTRLLISFELLIGACLIFRYLYRPVILISMGTIAAFSIFLIYLWAVHPEENCHCFGEVAAMNPAESLIKNILIMGLLLILWKKESLPILPSWSKLLLPVFAAISLGYPIYYSFPTAVFSSKPTLTEKQASIEFSEQLITILKKHKIQDADQGKKIICVYSTGCKHCKNAAHKMHLIEKEMGILFPAYYTFLGSESRIAPFWEESKAPEKQSILLEGNDAMNISEGRFPSIFLIEDGRIVYRLGFLDLNTQIFEDFLTP